MSLGFGRLEDHRRPTAHPLRECRGLGGQEMWPPLGHKISIPLRKSDWTGRGTYGVMLKSSLGFRRNRGKQVYDVELHALDWDEMGEELKDKEREKKV